MRKLRYRCWLPGIAAWLLCCGACQSARTTFQFRNPQPMALPVTVCATVAAPATAYRGREVHPSPQASIGWKYRFSRRRQGLLAIPGRVVYGPEAGGQQHEFLLSCGLPIPRSNGLTAPRAERIRPPARRGIMVAWFRHFRTSGGLFVETLSHQRCR